LVLDGPDYPPLLALLDSAPPALTVLGDVGALAARAVAMVGARNASANGQRVAEMLAADLALAGIVVVSGMARGIDAAAHAGALSTGRTVAAIAGGIDIAYPPENADLQRRVAAGGAVVAEAPFGTAPQARHFPRRNRVIAGLSLGVVVVEAAPQSGSLITARMAQDEGRELFAVPGSPLDPRCRGSNDLIRSGAHLTETAADVLANLPDHPSREGLARSPMFAHGQVPGLSEPPPEAISPAPKPDAVRNRVIELLGYSPTAVDDLVRRCQFSASVVVTALLELELADRVEMLPGNQVVLVG
jgi:DNA processing protein